MIITNPEDIELYALMTKRTALVLEMRGLKRQGRSAYSLIKEEFGLKGNRQKVYDTFSVMVQSMKDQQQGEA